MLVVLASVWIIRNTTINGDISAFLPSKPSEAQQILVDQLQDGVVSRILLMAIEGGDEAQRVSCEQNVSRATHYIAKLGLCAKWRRNAHGT